MNEEQTVKESAFSALKELAFWLGVFLFTLALFFALKPLVEVKEYSVRAYLAARYRRAGLR